MAAGFGRFFLDPEDRAADNLMAAPTADLDSGDSFVAANIGAEDIAAADSLASALDCAHAPKQLGQSSHRAAWRRRPDQ